MPTLVSLADDPEALERLYREDPAAFIAALPAARAEKPESLVLRAWEARLAPGTVTVATPTARDPASLRVLLLLAFGVLALFQGVQFGKEWELGELYARFAPLLSVALVGAFLLRGAPRSREAMVFGGGTLLLLHAQCGVILLGKWETDTSIIATIHTPLALASLLVVAHAGRLWKETEARLTFIRFAGESVIHTVLVLLGGIVLTVLTIAILTGVFGIHDTDGILERLVVPGLVLAPMFGVYVTQVALRGVGRLAAILSAIFIPLFLVLVLVTLVGMVLQGGDPFRDREFLITINGLMLVVWAMTVFSIAHGQADDGRVARWLRGALVLTTLGMNTIAISAFIFRTLETGFTPNRVTALGANLVVSIHLVLILAAMVRSRGNADPVRAVVARYLPVYSAWTWANVLLLPLIFGFD